MNDRMGLIKEDGLSCSSTCSLDRWTLLMASTALKVDASSSQHDDPEFVQILNIVRSCVASQLRNVKGYREEFIGEYTEPVTRYEKSVSVIVSHVRSEHERELSLMCEKLSVTKETLYATFRDVAKELFLAKVNWGRIVLLIAFTGSLCEYCLDNSSSSGSGPGRKGKRKLVLDDPDLPHCIEQLTLWTAEFMHEELGQWIKENDGWVSESTCRQLIDVFNAIDTGS